MDFASGTYVVDEVYSMTCTAPTYTTSDLSDAIAALIANGSKFAFIVLCGTHADASTASTIKAAMDTHMETLAAAFRYARYIMSAGTDAAADVLTDFTAKGNRGLAGFGDTGWVTANPFIGWGNPDLDKTYLWHAVLAGLRTPSGNLGRVASGPLPSACNRISHDERALASGLHEAGIATLRTFMEKGVSDFFATGGPLYSAEGSDFTEWELGRVMDIACTTVAEKQVDFINRGVRINGDGTLNAKDKEALEGIVEEALDARLLQPTNDEGTQGYVSAVTYQINGLINVGATRRLQSKVSIRPLIAIQGVDTELGYTIEQEV